MWSARRILNCVASVIYFTLALTTIIVQPSHDITVREGSTELFTIDIWRLIFSLSLVSALYHTAVTIWIDLHDEWMHKRLSPGRWWEFTSTFTTMTLAVFALNDIEDAHILALVICTVASHIFMGLALEYTNQPQCEEERSIWETQPTSERCWCQRLSPKNGHPLRSLTPYIVVAAVGTGIASYGFTLVGMVSALLLTLAAASTGVRFPYDVNFSQFVLHWGIIETCALQVAALIWIVWDASASASYTSITALVGYCIFAIITIICYWQRTRLSYERAETAYTITGILARSIFVILICADTV